MLCKMDHISVCLGDYVIDFLRFQEVTNRLKVVHHYYLLKLCKLYFNVQQPLSTVAGRRFLKMV